MKFKKNSGKILTIVFFAFFGMSFHPSYSQIHLEILRNSKTKNFKEIVQQVEEYYKNRDKSKGTGYKQFKRWENFNRTRLDSLGRIVNISEKNLYGYQQYLRQQKKISQKDEALATTPWTSVGPKQVNKLINGTNSGLGRVNCITVDPADSNIIYIGSPKGGLWRSIDAGNSWICLTDNITTTVGVSGITIDYSSPKTNRTLFIYTGDGDGGTLNSVGIFKSTDNGNSWIKTNYNIWVPNGNPGETELAGPYKLAIHPQNPAILFAVCTAAILKSTDGGINWSVKITGNFSDLEFNPSSPNIIYATKSGQFYRSTDTGDTWTKITNGLPISTYRVALAVTQANPSYVYVLYGGTPSIGQFGGLYRSTDNGLNFSLKSNTPNILGYNQSGTDEQSWYDLTLAVSSKNSEEVYAGGVMCYKSQNGGSSWNNYLTSSDGSMHVDIHQLEYFGSTLYCGNDGGIYRNNSKSSVWTDISSGLSITELYRFGLDATNADKIIYGAQDNGINILSNGISKLWSGGDGMESFIDPSNTKTWYGSTQYGDLYRSDDDGISLNVITPSTNGYRLWQTPFYMDPVNYNTLYVGYTDLWKSTNKGATWSNVTNGSLGTEFFNEIAVAPSNNQVIYTCKEGILYKSKDGGKTWTSTSMSQDVIITYIAVHPIDANTLWLSCGGYQTAIKVLKSTDGGNTWTNVSGTLPNIPASTIVYQKGSTNGLYLGTDIGVFYKDDNLNDWVKLGSGLPYCVVNELEIHYPSKKIRVATYGRGIWETNLYGSSNNAPIVSITSPTNGQVFTALASITINANASDSDGSIAKVEFYQGTTKLGEDLTAPYSFAWNNVTLGTYSITAKATDNLGAQSTSSAITITVSGTNCTASGTILREYWAGVSGSSVSQIPVTVPPTSTSNLNIFEGPTNVADNYGARYSGYVCAPITGAYIFWIACNDNGELWLSTDENPSNKVKIAYVVSYTGVREWDKLIYQKSVNINLVAGKRYYIEALHKEGLNSDNLAVGWQLPNGTQERPIPGNRLSPYSTGGTNIPPTVSIMSPSNGQSYNAPANITINANASDTDGSITKVEFFQGTTKLGEDLTSPYSFAWNNVTAGSYSITAKATDNVGAQTTSSAISISVTTSSGESPCSATGTITRDVWSNITGSAITDIPVNQTPTTTTSITSFKGPNNAADNYGARYRGYICPPTTGNYTFWIESDKNSELYLSTNSNPVNKIKIAYVIGATGSMDFNKYPSQKSTLIQLVAGQAYYIEALHKESTGTDHCAVRWQIPSGAIEAPIPGIRLAPYSGTINTPPLVSITSPTNGQSFTAPANFTINANASDADGSISKVEFFQGTTKLGEDLTNPYSFTWNNVLAGSYTITAKATDNQGAQATSSPIAITISANTNCTASGTILREYWSGVSGMEVSQIPVTVPPTSTSNLNIFEGPTNVADNYGARYSGYVCAPITGTYTFWIACNDKGELWLSTDDSPSNKVKIAYVASYTGVREWDKLIYQKSASINLIAGKKYYIEALHKEGLNSDNLAVGWQLPNGTQERPIPSNRLSPNISSKEADPITLSMDEENSKKKESTIKVNAYPNPVSTDELSITIEGYQENKYKVHIDILSIQGKNLYSNKVNCDVTCPRTIIPIDHAFTKGIYIIKVRIDGMVYTEKLLIN